VGSPTPIPGRGLGPRRTAGAVRPGAAIHRALAEACGALIAVIVAVSACTPSGESDSAREFDSTGTTAPTSGPSEVDWMIPGVDPTGKRVEIPLVAIVRFVDDKVAHEHIYWDQASASIHR